MPFFISAIFAAGLLCAPFAAQAANVDDCLMKSQLNDATGEFLMLVRPISHYPIAARSR